MINIKTCTCVYITENCKKKFKPNVSISLSDKKNV